MPETKAKKSSVKLNPEEMTQAGLHFGHKPSKIHPKMKPYLVGVRNGICIIDLEKSIEKLNECLDFVKELTKEGKVLLMVGTKVQAKGVIKEIASECGLPYVCERWLGGTITNFEVIKKRVDHFKDLESKMNSGEFNNYTKKERANIEKEIKILREKFGGIKNLEKIPDALFILDIKKDNLAVKEAKAKGIKIIGISDTNTDPSLLDYVIPANDDATTSLKYILDKVKDIIVKNKKEI